MVATVLIACGIETCTCLGRNPISISSVATALTACGIETKKINLVKSQTFIWLQQCLSLAVLKLVLVLDGTPFPFPPLQQRLPLAVCDEGCEIAEEQSNDEVRTSLVPDRRENKGDKVAVLTSFCMCQKI